jgi:hypothetical protein
MRWPAFVSMPPLGLVEIDVHPLIVLAQSYFSLPAMTMRVVDVETPRPRDEVELVGALVVHHNLSDVVARLVVDFDGGESRGFASVNRYSAR